LKLFVCNVMTQPGETDGYTASDHLDAIEAHVGAPLFHAVIVNNGDIPPDVLAKYAEEGASVVVCDEEKLQARGIRVIADQLIKVQTYLRHDAVKLSHHIERLVQDWISGKR